MGLTGRHRQQRKIHGAHGITDAQMRVLRTWTAFLDRNRYHPTQSELARLAGVSTTQISEWMDMWERQGLVVRGKGLRNNRMSTVCNKMLLEIETLDMKWRDYIARRDQFIRDYSFPISRQAFDTDLSGEDTGYEE